MGFFTLNNQLSVWPANANEGYNNSWLQVDNDADRLLYAQAHYITNFEDLEIVLNTKNTTIGSIEINDPINHSLKVSVANTPVGGALRVLSQDLEADVDTVSLGDIQNNKVGINVPLSALNVYVSNEPLITISNPTLSYATSALQTTSNNYLNTQIGWLKALSSTNVTVLNPTTGYATSALQTTTNNYLNTQIGWLKSLSSTNVLVLNPSLGFATSGLQLDQITLLQGLTSQILNYISQLLSGLSSTNVTILNPLTGYSTDSLQLEQISLLNSLTSINSDSFNYLLQGLSSTSVTVLNPTTAITINNPVSAVVVLNPLSAVNLTNTNITVAYGDNSGNLDAFSRLRVSTPTTLFDSKTLHNKASLFWSQLANGTGAAVNFTGEFRDASVTLSAINVGEYAIRQTTQRFNYQPGKSQLALFTGILKPEDHCIKRYGLFQSLTSAPYTPNVGLYFETLTTSPTSIAVVQANEGFLVPSLSATRDNWNIDKLDGSGPSKKILQLSAANIFLIDYEWLGVGRVRFGTVIDGQVCYCHQFNNAGNVQGAYIRTPNLPVRAELRQIATGTSELKMICSSVMSEGGADFTGVTRAVSTGAAITIAADERRVVLGVRLQYNKLDSVNEVLNISGLVLASNRGNAASACFKYELIINPSLATAGTWTDVDGNSNFQVWNGSSAVNSDGTVIVSGYSGAGGTIDLSGYRFEKFLRLGCSVDGRRDELYLVMTPLQANDGVFGSITFIESD